LENNSLIDSAIEVASKAHRNQLRKGTDIPYITHPLSVGILLFQVNCSDEVIAAGILHDTLEDAAITLEYIQKNFGEKVASIVKGCSEPDKSLPWEERKNHTIESLKTASMEVRLVACADKLHNIRTIASDYDKIGDEIWERFKKGKEKQEWYYRQLIESLNIKSENESYLKLFKLLRDEVESVFGTR